MTFTEPSADLAFSFLFCFRSSKWEYLNVRTLTLTFSAAVVVVTEGTFGCAETRRRKDTVGRAGRAGQRPRPTAGGTQGMALCGKTMSRTQNFNRLSTQAFSSVFADLDGSAGGSFSHI